MKERATSAEKLPRRRQGEGKGKRKQKRDGRQRVKQRGRESKSAGERSTAR